jgi:hypothetical protein
MFNIKSEYDVAANKFIFPRREYSTHSL